MCATEMRCKSTSLYFFNVHKHIRKTSEQTIDWIQYRMKCVRHEHKGQNDNDWKRKKIEITMQSQREKWMLRTSRGLLSAEANAKERRNKKKKQWKKVAEFFTSMTQFRYSCGISIGIIPIPKDWFTVIDSAFFQRTISSEWKSFEIRGENVIHN